MVQLYFENKYHSQNEVKPESHTRDNKINTF
jgi:hypothetical protein